jgi:hypothetical protein
MIAHKNRMLTLVLIISMGALLIATLIAQINLASVT